MAHLTLEEVAARRAEVRQVRELMFRADVKAKRVAKIKSKTYRKIQRKLKDKNTLTAEEMQLLDPEAEEAERMKAEMERAKERATMRHKNTGKWARQVMGRGKDMDADQRRELMAQLEKGDRLRRRIQGLGSDDEGELEGGSDGESGGEDDNGAGIANRAFDELAALDREQPSGDDGPGLKKKKHGGIMDMKFMRDAAAREDREADAMADDFRAELVGLTGNGDDVDDGAEKEVPISTALNVGGNEGRLVFRPAASEVRTMFSFYIISDFH